MHDRLIKEIDGLSDIASALFEAIAEASREGAGISRPAFCKEETQAGELIKKFAESEGLQCGVDGGGNFQYDLDGKDRQSMTLMASHLDSVPMGGNYDGLAGVIAGTLVQAACRRAGIEPPRRLRTLGFRGEESPWFGTAYLGSKLALGKLSQQDLDGLTHIRTKQSLASHLKTLGVQADEAVIRDKRLRHEDIHSYLELHIEQGPVLEDQDIPIGLATAIRGNIRHPFSRCVGVYGHSSTSPRHLRKDAVIATSHLVCAADRLWKQCLDEGGNDDLIINFGIFSTNPAHHAMTKVPGEVDFSFNIAGTNNAVARELYRQIRAEADRIQDEFRVCFDFGSAVGTDAIHLDAGLIATAEAAASGLGMKSLRMPTVGHDAAMFAQLGIATGMVLVRNQHGSHNVDEAMRIEDFIDATKVLALCALK